MGRRQKEEEAPPPAPGVQQPGPDPVPAEAQDPEPAPKPEKPEPLGTLMKAHFSGTLHLVLEDGTELDLPASEDGRVDAPPEAVAKLLEHRLASHITE